MHRRINASFFDAMRDILISLSRFKQNASGTQYIIQTHVMSLKLYPLRPLIIIASLHFDEQGPLQV